MSNMGYCRFRNTLKDLQDCMDHIFDDDLSPEEHRARAKLIELAQEIAYEFEDEEDIEQLQYEE